MHPILAEIFGPDLIIVIIVVALVLFGGSQIPKLARSLGSAQSEFKKGLADGSSGSESESGEKPATPGGPAAAADGGTTPAPGSGSPTAPGGPPSQ